MLLGAFFVIITASDQKLSRTHKHQSSPSQTYVPGVIKKNQFSKSYDKQLKIDRKSERGGKSQVSSPLANNISFFKGIRDELVDCFDSLVFAENNDERLQNAKNIIRRHQATAKLLSCGLVAGGVVTVILKRR